MAKKDSTDVFMTELDAYLFGEGTHYEIYNKMGAHKAVKHIFHSFLIYYLLHH